MPTIKKVDVPDDVKTIILNMEWVEVEGKTIGRIVQQLDRPTYVRVNKVLAALDGKWDKRKQFRGHVFDDDPRPDLQGGTENGYLEVTQYDSFYTPHNTVEFMLDLANLKWRRRLLEPSAGDGRIIIHSIARAPGLNCCWCEINPKARRLLEGFSAEKETITELGEDFMQIEPFPEFDVIVMNPPFSKRQDIDHVFHAWEFLGPGGRLVSVMAEGTFFAQENKCAIFREWVEGYRHEVHDLPAGTFQESGTDGQGPDRGD